MSCNVRPTSDASSGRFGLAVRRDEAKRSALARRRFGRRMSSRLCVESCASLTGTATNTCDVTGASMFDE